MERRLLVILSIITLDAVGIGLIFPILPRLLMELTGSAEVSVLYGVVVALYSLMQFVFSPVLGAMSDRYGRRPVLLASITGATVDYLVMAFSPLFAVLLIGRAIAGVTSANMAVATAYIADITDESERAKRFGYMSACFGIGFIVGPLIGGVLGDAWLRGPFVVAAVLNGANLALVFLVLPESREHAKAPPKPLSKVRRAVEAFNPIGPMRWAFGVRPLVPLIGMVFLVGLIGNIPGTVWVLYGMDKFHWNGVTVGFSLATFGVCHAGSQVLLVGPVTKRFGELKTIVIGAVFDCVAFVIIGLATHGWVAFAIAPLFAIAGVGPPAVQSLATKDVSDDRQGELQGVLSSVTSLTAIVGPLLGTFLYAATKHTAIGAVWFCGAAIYLVMVPLVIARRRMATP